MIKKTTPLLPELTVPMHQSSQAFRIDFDGIDDPHLNAAVRQNEKVDSMMNKINEVREKILADRTLNEPAKKATFLRFVQKKSRQITKEINTMTHVVDAREDELSAKINAPIKREAGGREAAEIRRHVAGLEKKSDRLNFIKKRIDAGDFESSSSVLGSKFYLAGLDETNQQTLLQYYRKQRFTQEMAAQEGLDKVGKAALHKIAILEKFRKSLSSKQTLRDMAGQDAVEQALRS